MQRLQPIYSFLSAYLLFTHIWDMIQSLFWQHLKQLQSILIKIRGEKASKYKCRGVFVKRYQDGKPEIDYNISDQDKNDRIISYKTRSCSILHPSFSWICTAFIKLVPFLDQVEHWWVTIETQNGKIYNLQHISLAEVYSRQNTLESKKRQSDQNALSLCWLRNRYARIWDQRRYCKDNVANKTINDVIEWLKTDDVPAQYKLLTNNCQDICRKFYKTI